ncbi:MAG: PilN domain-containing protein [Methylococcales bacterium]|nr:PilN domain-containing protein [Methylococcales bacterium]
MVKINLLPWREELQRYKQQEFLVSLGLAVVITCFLFALGYYYIEGRKTYQSQRNAYLEVEIVKLDKKIATIKDINTKKNQLRDKIKIIEGFQANRSEIIHVIDELRKITPRGISLASFVQKKAKITLKGFLIANSEVPLLMDAIVLSAWLELDGTGLKAVDGRDRREQKENEIGQIEEKKYSKFTILAKQVKKKDKNKEEDAEGSDNKENSEESE